MADFSLMFGAPTTPAQRDYQLDPRRSLAMALLEKSLVQQPVQSHAEGISKLGQALIGGLMARQSRDEFKDSEKATADTIGRGIAALNPDPLIGAEATTRPKSGLSEMAAILAADPSTAQAGQQVALTGYANQQALEAEKRKPMSIAPGNTVWSQGGGPLFTAPIDEASAAQHASAPVKNYTYREQLVAKFGEGSEQVNRFDTYVRQNPWLDLGGTRALPDPARPGALSAEIPKTIPPEQLPATKAAQAAAVKTAETQTQSALDYPKLEGETKYSIDLLDKALSHPGLPGVVGMPNVSGALRLPGTKETDFRTLLDQMQGRQFMQAYETLKGGGVITEVEGTKATQALARMSSAQTEDEFKKGLEEFKGVLVQGLQRAKAKAGTAAPQPQGAPAAGGIKFLGFE